VQKVYPDDDLSEQTLGQLKKMLMSKKDEISERYFQNAPGFSKLTNKLKKRLVKKGQQQLGMKASGKLNLKTLMSMVNSDPYVPAPSAYTLYADNSHWKKKQLSWRLNSVSTDMNPCHQRNAVRRALRIYSEKFELDFTEITDPAAKVDIDIMFSTDNHNPPVLEEDSSIFRAFKGDPLTLGWGWAPGLNQLSGNVHITDVDNWVHTLGGRSVRQAHSYSGQGENATCVFPFTAEGKSHHGCIKSRNHPNLKWCGTTVNWDDDRSRFGFCENEYLLTYGGNSKGAACVFPFRAERRLYEGCTMDGREDGYKWCATTSDFDKDGKWGMCPGRERKDGYRQKGRGGQTIAQEAVNVIHVLAHELGHAMGLEHSKIESALMYPANDGVFRGLTDDDVRGLSQLYRRRAQPYEEPLELIQCGAKTAKELTTAGLVEHVVTTEQPYNEHPVDEVLVEYGQLFVFKDLKLWRLVEIGEGYKAHEKFDFEDAASDFELSQEIWPGSWDHIDAFVDMNHYTGRYLFSGRDVYEYARGGGTTQPRKLTDFGLPASVEKVDTVMTVDNYKSVSKMYLFVGDSYYTCTLQGDVVTPDGEPKRPMSDWSGASYDLSNLDAAFSKGAQFGGNAKYFIKGRNVYVYDNARAAIVEKLSLEVFLGRYQTFNNMQYEGLSKD